MHDTEPDTFVYQTWPEKFSEFLDILYGADSFSREIANRLHSTYQNELAGVDPPQKMTVSHQSPEVKSISIRAHDLKVVLLNQSLDMAVNLLSKEIISHEDFSKILVDSCTPPERAAILFEAVKSKMEIWPEKFSEFLGILSRDAFSQEVAERLHSTYQSELAGADQPLKTVSHLSPEVKSVSVRTHDLTVALSKHDDAPLTMAAILFSKGMISMEILENVSRGSLIKFEKAAILIKAVRNKMEIAPEKFSEFLEILSGETFSREVAASLRSTYQGELLCEQV